jgi:hypothetical protein
MPTHKRFKTYAKGHWTKAAKAARSQAYRERLALAATRRLAAGPKRKYVKSGLFSKRGRSSAGRAISLARLFR